MSDKEAMAPNTPPNVTLQVPQSTPIKGFTATTEPFTTTQKFRIESCAAMADEMTKFILGPMPAQRFLDAFLPTEDIPGYHPFEFHPGCYDTTVYAQSEKDAYDPFVGPSTSFAFMYISRLSLFSRMRRRGNTSMTSNSSIHPHTPIATRIFRSP
jgi:hypothetical protein